MTFSLDAYTIQPILEKDEWLLCNFICANQDRFQDFLPKTVALNLTPDLSRVFIKNCLKHIQTKTQYLFTIKQKGLKQLVGIVYLKEIDWKIKKGEFAYGIDYNFKGNRLISKVITVLGNYAFNTMKLQRLEIIAHKANTASIGVALANQFVWEKTIVNAFTPSNGISVNMELYVKEKNRP